MSAKAEGLAPTWKRQPQAWRSTSSPRSCWTNPEGLCLAPRLPVAQTLSQLAWCLGSWVQPVLMARELGGEGALGSMWPLPGRPDPQPGDQPKAWPGKALGPMAGSLSGGGNGWG